MVRIMDGSWVGGRRHNGTLGRGTNWTGRGLEQLPVSQEEARAPLHGRWAALELPDLGASVSWGGRRARGRGARATRRQPPGASAPDRYASATGTAGSQRRWGPEDVPRACRAARVARTTVSDRTEATPAQVRRF